MNTQIERTHSIAEPYDAVVIGGGQAGLAMGYYLARAGLRFAILDAGDRIGQAWEERYDSLRLFTPTEYNGLPGMPFPAAPGYYPTKDEAAAYLRAYAAHFALPVRLETRVTSLERDGAASGAAAADQHGLFRIGTSRGSFAAHRVVVASGPFQRPHTPGFAAELSREVPQIHSAAYRNPAQVPAGDVLVVGAGNSGAQIAEELSREGDRAVFLAVGGKPARLPQRVLGRDILWWLEKTGLLAVSGETRLGRKLRRANPLIGTSLPRLVNEGSIALLPRVTGAEGGDVLFADGTRRRFTGAIWATGYRPDYSWLRLPVLDDRGSPVHTRGVTAVPGLYFLGLYWQHRRDSALLGGVKHDAAFLAERMGASQISARATGPALAPQPVG